MKNTHSQFIWGRLARILPVGMILFLLSSCSDLSVFVPGGSLSNKEIEQVKVNEEGYFTVSLKKFTKNSKEGYDLYIEKVKEAPAGLSLTDDMQSVDGIVSFKPIEIDRTETPSKKGLAPLSFTPGEELIIDEAIDTTSYYIFQAVPRSGDRSRAKKAKVLIAKAGMKALDTIEVKPIDDKIRIEWTAVDAATGYEIFADEAGTKLIGRTTDNFFELEASAAPSENIWVRPTRGSLSSPELKGALLTLSKVAIKSITYPDSVYQSGGKAPIKIQYSAPVFAEAGTTIDIDGSGRKAVLVSGSGTDTLVFEYPISAADENVSLSVKAPTGVKDKEGLPVVSVLPPTTDPKVIAIDNSKPTPPTSPGFASLISADGKVDGLWGPSSDENLSSYSAKLCASSDCSTGCNVPVKALESPASFTGVADGQYHLCVKAEDKAGLSSDWAVSLAQVLVQTGPTGILSVTSSKADGIYTVGEIIPISVHFSRTIAVTNSGQISLELETGATDRKATYAGGSASSTLTFHYTVAAGDESLDLQYSGINALDLGASGTIRDAAGRNAVLTLPLLASPESLAEGKAIRIDTGAPTSPSAVSFTGATSNTTSFTMSWVNGSDPHFQTHEVKLCQASNCSTSCVSAQNVVASPAVMTGVHGGTYYGCVQSRDAAGNVSGFVSSAASISVDTSAPTVLNVSSTTANGAYKTGDSITISLQFSEVVNVTNTGDLRLALETGTTDREATFVSGSGTDTLLFSYTVVSGDMSADLNVQSATALSLGASGTIRDVSGNDAIRTLPTSGGTSLAGQKALVIDTSLPLVDAGLDRKVRLSANLNGVVSDTGSGIQSYSWTKVSGTGTITFGTANAEDTTISSDTEGTFVIRLTATDNAGNSASDDLTFVWDTTAPLVNVGGDLSTNAEITVNASVSDALSGVASYAWTKVSGSGTITFGTQAAEDTTVQASADDTYVLRLTVTDEAGNSSFDTLSLVWNTAGANVNAGSDQIVAASTTLNGSASGPSPVVSYDWAKVSGPGTLTFGTASAEDTTVTASADGVYVISLSVVDSASNTASDTMTLTWDTTAPSVNAGTDINTNGPETLNATTSDALSGIVTYAWTKVSGPGNVTFGSPSSEDSTVSVDADGTYVLRLTVTDASGNSANDTLTLIKDATLPTVDAGVTVKANALAAIDGTASDTSGLASYAWSQVSGPGTVTFSAATSVDTNASASVEGTYVLRLTVLDNFGNSAHDDMTFVWDTTAPTVNAGIDHSSSSSSSLDATASDALSGIASYAWSQVSGPGTATFGTPSAVDTTVSANTDGTYVLQLTVTDQAGNSASDTMTFIRDTAGPSVNAGPDLKANASALLDGTVTDAGTSVASYSWTKVSGPGTLSFSQATSVDTQVTADTNGTYVIRLTALDAVGNSSSDEMTFVWDTLNPSVNAGADFHARNSSNLNATTSDAHSGLSTYAWTKVSGPGTVTFGTAASEDSTVSADADGTYVLQLAVTDQAGNTGSDTIVMVWDTTAPSVSAGADLSLNASGNLNGTVTDSSPIASYAWTKVSGPGTVTFGSAAAEDSTVSVSADGTYVLRLTSVDAAGNSAFDEMTLVWDALAPSVDAGVTVKARIATLVDATASDGSGIASYAWTKQAGVGTVTFSDSAISDPTVSASLEGTYTLRLTVTDTFGNSAFDDMTFVWDTTAPSVNAGVDVATSTTGNLNATVSDALAGIATYAWTKVSGPGTITFGTPSAEDTTVSSNADGVHVLQLTVTDQAGNSASDTMTFTKDSSGPTVDAGPNRTVNASTLLDGTVSDATSTIASYAWSMVSGPGVLTFTAQTSVDTNVTASVNGTYVVRLTAVDAVGNSANDTMTLIWDTVAPSVNAGADFHANSSRNINATTSDATSGIASYAWSKSSGPGTLTFGTGTAEDTTVTASAAGTYVIELTVTDNAGNSASDTVQMIWDTTAPTVNVGVDRLVNALTAIDASVSDSSPISTYAWTKASGAGTITFSAPSAEDTNVSASADGVYVLRLTATDAAGNSSFDELTFEWDATAPSAPSNVSVGTAYSQTTSFSMSWTVSTDLHFSTHNTKICTDSACSLGCTSASNSATSPLSMTGVDGTTYYGCVRGVDTLGNTTAWIASPTTKTVDTTAPSGGAISIAAGATYSTTTAVTLTLGATGATQMYVTNTAGCGSGGTWETYATSRAWTLPTSNASNTVYVKYRDAATNESSCVNDAIIHDSTAPASPSISINTNAYTTTNTAVTLTLSATDTNTVADMYITNTAGCGSGGTWESYATSKAWTLPTANDTNTVYVRFRDPAGNVSACANDSIIHSNQAPTSPSIQINANAASTSSSNVTLNLAANQATEMYITHAAGCSVGGTWQAFSSTPAWTIAPNVSNVATVYVKFRSASLNETSCLNDTINSVPVDIMTNGGFESNSFTGWTNHGTYPWSVVNTNAFAGTYTAQVNSGVVGDNVTSCINRTVDLNAASTNYYVGFAWNFGTETNYDFARLRVDGTNRISGSGNQPWTTQGTELQRGAWRSLDFCFQRDVSYGGYGDFVRIDDVKVVPVVPLPATAVTVRGYNNRNYISWTHASQRPSNYIVLRGTTAVTQILVNGTNYNVNDTVGAYTVVDKSSDEWHNDTGLTNGTTYHYGVFAVTLENNYSLVATASGVPTALHAPDTYTVLPGRNKVHQEWAVTAGGSQTGYLIVRRSGSAVNFTPTNGTNYNVNDAVANAGTVVYKGNALNWIDTGASTAGTTYHYKIWAYGAGNTYSTEFVVGNAAPVNCNGTDWSSSCWKLSAVAQSCESVCRDNGMRFEPNRLETVFAAYGNDRTPACQAIFSNMGVVADTTDHVWIFGGPRGCSKIIDGRFMYIGDNQSEANWYKYDGALTCPCY